MSKQGQTQKFTGCRDCVRVPMQRRHCRARGLPPHYHRLHRIWLLLGIPVLASVLAILWLMIARPVLQAGA